MVATPFKGLFVSLLLLCQISVLAQNSSALAVESDPYDNGMELFRKGQFANAQRLLDEVVADDYSYDREMRATAAYYAALSAMKLYNSDADQRVDDFAENFELSPLVNSLNFRYANYRFSLKRYREAAEYYEKTDKYRLSDKDVSEYYFKKAYSHLSIEEPAEAKPLFFELKDGNSEYATSARYYYGHLLYADSSYSEALRNFLPLRDDESFGPLIPYYLAQIYYKLGDYEKLLEVGEELIEDATPSRAPEIAKLMGDAFYNKGDYKNAVKYLQLYDDKGGRLRRKDHFQLGYSYYKTQQWEKAISSFNKITRGRGNEALQQNAYYHLGDLYLKRKQPRKAITAFKAAAEIKASPSIREDAFFNYAKLAYELADPFQDAISTLNAYLDAFPESPNRKEINRLLANLYITTKDYDRALDAIERTGINSPGMREAYQKIAFYRGNELFGALQYQAALKKYSESLQYPENTTITALTYYWQGESYFELGEFDKALESYSKFRNQPGAFNMSEFQHSLYNSGYAHFKLFDFEKAATAFRSFTRDADQKDKRLPDAYLRLADSYLLTSGYILAADFYQSALKTGTSEADYALFQRADAVGLAGNSEEKIQQLKRLLQQYPNSVYAEDAEFEIANTYLKSDQYQKAIAAYDRFISSRPGSDMLAKAKVQKGLAYSNTDRNQKAIEVFKSVVAQHPGTEASIEAVSLARLSYARSNRIDEYLDWVDGIDFVNFSQSEMDSTAFSTAFDQYSSGNCKEAIDALGNYLKRFDDGLFRYKALLYQAECAQRLNRSDLAERSYRELLDAPGNEYRLPALAYLSEAALAQKEHAEARRLYKNWLELASKPANIRKAELGLLQANRALGDYAQAKIYAQSLLQDENLPNAIWREAKSVLAQALVEEGAWEAAMQELQSLADQSSGELKAEAYYMMATVRYEQRDYEASNDLVYKLIEEVPDYKEWKLKALILSARNFWKQEDIFQANYTLDYVIDSDFSQAIIDEAQNLKDKIEVEERNKAEQKKRDLQKQDDSLMINDGDGMMIIDQAEQQNDTLQNKELR